MAHLLLIDGNSILNRAFYGVRATQMLTTRDGTPTNAVYGFVSTLNKYMDDLKPSAVLIAFDMKAPTFRHGMHDGYKATRKGMPDELAVQMPIIKDVLKAMRIKIMEKEGLEADDIIGILSHICEHEGHPVTILTGDRDALQLVSPLVTVYIPSTGKDGTETNIYNPEAVMAKYGVTPTQMIEVKGLMGDASDNIPGVPSVGEKTALELIKTYQTIDGVYAHLDEIKKPKLLQNLTEFKEQAYLSRELGTILRGHDLGISLEDLHYTGVDREELLMLFRQLEFTTFIRKMRLDEVVPMMNTATDPEPVLGGTLVSTVLDLKQIPTQMKHLYLLPIGYNVQEGSIAALVIFDGEQAWFVRVGDELPLIQVTETVDQLCQHTETLTIHDMKVIARLLLDAGKQMPETAFDTMLAGYLLDPASDRYDITRLSAVHLNRDIASPEALVSNAGRKGVLPEDLLAAAYTAVRALPAIRSAQETQLSEQRQMALFETIEKPLAIVLADMERVGFKVDPVQLAAYDERLAKRINELEASIHFFAGGPFNIHSTKQLGVILFEQLGLKSFKKTKTGYSTDVEVLEELKHQHEIVPALLEYRQLTKLKSTYSEGLMKVISPQTGRIHSRFNQTIAVTGRISSTEPNLQNIPIRTEMGRQIRKVFVPEPGCVFVDADYSQIELRVLAHITGDKMLQDAFLNGIDIHTLTASQVFGIPTSEVNGEMRRRAKAVNFGIIYGISDFGLSQDLGITRKEAKQYIDGYLDTYPGVREYMTRVVDEAEVNGYVETVFHRRRMLPELKSSNFNVRAFGKRVALNAPIQGTAADIIKIAMVDVWRRLREEKMQSQLVLQVHDELVIEAPIEEQERAKKIVREAMEGAVEMSVPLLVDMATGYNWFDAK